MLHIRFKKIVGNDFEYRDFYINEIKYSKDMIAIDIVDIGWRSLTSEQYDGFEVKIVS